MTGLTETGLNDRIDRDRLEWQGWQRQAPWVFPDYQTLFFIFLSFPGFLKDLKIYHFQRFLTKFSRFVWTLLQDETEAAEPEIMEIKNLKLT